MPTLPAKRQLVNVAIPSMPGDPLLYRVPEGWPDLLRKSGVTGSSSFASQLLGRRVLVPLSNRTRVGIVVPPFSSIDEGALEPGKLKYVEALLDQDSAALSPELVLLCAHVVRRYLCDWGEVIQAALPKELLSPPNVIVRWIGPELEGMWPEEVTSKRSHITLSRFLAGEGRVSASVLRKRFPRLSVDSVLIELADQGLIEREERISDIETVATADWVIVEGDASIETIPANATARRRIFDALLDLGGECSWLELRKLTRVTRDQVNKMADAGLVRWDKRTRDVIGLGFDPRTQEGPPPPLTDEQNHAVEEVAKRIESGKREVFLLDGLPGTGKTRVYVELIAKARELGKGVLVLVPEISLTPQVVARIRQVIHEPVVVMHSGMQSVQRTASWRALHRGEAGIVVGPRSAVFAPVRDLGLVIVDEEHEEAYKQQDPAPRYHGRDLAAARGWMTNAPVLLASATPSLETMYLVNERKRAIRLPLTQRFGASWPKVRVLDRRREAEDAPYIGPELAEAIASCTGRGEGVILLITRRGYAPILQCHNCGDTQSCPNCDISLTFHTKGSRKNEAVLRCHLCGYNRRVPNTCGICNADDLRVLGVGTQRIEEEILQRFPDLIPTRMDRDTLRRVGEQERILREFAAGESHILLGTQLVAKGHDFSHVTLVGVINADPALNQPDFRASERTFRLLVQAAGRAGRGDKPGEVIIQTLRPEHTLFGYLAKPARDSFIEMEMNRRLALEYPPYAHLTVLTLSGNDDEAVRSSAFIVADYIRHYPGELSLLGPEPAFIKRVKRKYRWRLMVKSSKSVDGSGEQMRSVLRAMMKAVNLETGVRLSVDVDALEVA
ncbi:primosomal protein N' [bacterium BMS3Bbin04]|nr:primosomal protein N' [bacterium BMS3Bbin04]